MAYGKYKMDKSGKKPNPGDRATIMPVRPPKGKNPKRSRSNDTIEKRIKPDGTRVLRTSGIIRPGKKKSIAPGRKPMPGNGGDRVQPRPLPGTTDRPIPGNIIRRKRGATVKPATPGRGNGGDKKKNTMSKAPAWSARQRGGR